MSKLPYLQLAILEQELCVAKLESFHNIDSINLLHDSHCEFYNLLPSLGWSKEEYEKEMLKRIDESWVPKEMWN
jgi:hypothetical protein